MSTIQICDCRHMVSMHSEPKEQGGPRPCFFSDCDCKDFSERPKEKAKAASIPIETIPVSPGEEYSPSAEPEPPPATLSFEEMRREVLRGHRATRKKWADPGIYILLFQHGHINENVPPERYLSLHQPNKKIVPLYLNQWDLQADDWVIVE